MGTPTHGDTHPAMVAPSATFATKRHQIPVPSMIGTMWWHQGGIHTCETPSWRQPPGDILLPDATRSWCHLLWGQHGGTQGGIYPWRHPLMVTFTQGDAHPLSATLALDSTRSWCHLPWGQCKWHPEWHLLMVTLTQGGIFSPAATLPPDATKSWCLACYGHNVVAPEWHPLIGHQPAVTPIQSDTHPWWHQPTQCHLTTTSQGHLPWGLCKWHPGWHLDPPTLVPPGVASPPEATRSSSSDRCR